MRRTIFVWGALLLLLTGVTSADLTPFTSFDAFDAATNTVLVEDFESGDLKREEALTSFTTSNGITYAGLQATNPNVWLAPAGYKNFGLGVDGKELTTSTVLTSTGYEFFKIELGANAAPAVGFDVYLNADGPVTTSYYGSTGNLLGTFSDTRGRGAVLFLGVLADEPIYRIEWASANVPTQQVNTGLDNLRLGEGTPVVPVPGAFLLGTMGLSLAGWLHRRNRP